MAGGSVHAAALRRDARGYDLALTQSASEARAALYTPPITSPTTTLSTTLGNTLPTRGSSFVDRDMELSELGKLLAQREFLDGVVFVALDTPTTPAYRPTMTEALTLPRHTDADLPEHVAHALGDKRVLFVLDSAERALEATPLLTLLQRCPNLTP